MKLLMHKPDAAYEFASKALSIARERGSKIREIEALRALGDTRACMNKIEEATKYLKDSISMAEKGGYDLDVAKACFTLGLILTKIRKDEAQFYLKRAKMIFEKSGAQKWLSLT